MSSPISVPPGHSSGSMDQLIAHYREKAFSEEEEKMQMMREGKIPGQKPWVEK